MNLFGDGLAWVLDPAHWGGVDGIGTHAGEHVLISLLVLAISSVIAIPLGWLIGHTGRGRFVVVALSGGVRALPTLGLLILLALWLGVGLEAPVIALVILSIPSTLAGAYAGFDAIDRRTIDAARAVGMTGWQVLWQVEVPLGLPLLIGGLRASALQVIATATLVDYVGGGGLGHFIFLGLQTADYAQMLGGSIIVIVLALLSEALFSILVRVAVPAGVRAGRSRGGADPDSRARSRRARQNPLTPQETP